MERKQCQTWLELDVPDQLTLKSRLPACQRTSGVRGAAQAFSVELEDRAKEGDEGVAGAESPLKLLPAQPPLPLLGTAFHFHKIMYSCVEFTEHAQLVHLVNPGFLGRSIARPHNNKDKVVFSALLSASFPKVSNYFLYFGSSSLSQEACFYVISKFCSLHGRSPRGWVPERTGAVDCKENLEGNFRWAQPCPSLPYLDP